MPITRRHLLATAPALMAPALLSHAGGARAADGALTVGLIPSEDSRAMIANSQAMMDMLSRSLGMPVKPFVAADYNGVIEALRSRRLDVAYLGPFSYVLGASVANIEAFAVAETKKAGRTNYHSLIVAHKDSGIRTLADLKGRSFAFVDPTSTSGHLFPKAGLLKAGFDPDKAFGRVIFSGSHDSNAVAVQNRKIDAVAIADRILDSAIAKGQPGARTWWWCGSPTPFPNRRRYGARTWIRSSRSACRRPSSRSRTSHGRTRDCSTASIRPTTPPMTSSARRRAS